MRRSAVLIRRYLILIACLLALSAALATAVFDGVWAQTDEAETPPSVELRVWQRIDSPLTLWIS